MKNIFKTLPVLATIFMASCENNKSSNQSTPQDQYDYAVTAWTPKGDTAWHVVADNDAYVGLCSILQATDKHTGKTYYASEGVAVTSIRISAIAPASKDEKLSGEIDYAVTAWTPKGDIAWHAITDDGAYVNEYGALFATDKLTGKEYSANNGVAVTSVPIPAVK